MSLKLQLVSILNICMCVHPLPKLKLNFVMTHLLSHGGVLPILGIPTREFPVDDPSQSSILHQYVCAVKVSVCKAYSMVFGVYGAGKSSEARLAFREGSHGEKKVMKLVRIFEWPDQGPV
jgi:hypothetical protein